MKSADQTPPPSGRRLWLHVVVAFAVAALAGVGALAAVSSSDRPADHPTATTSAAMVAPNGVVDLATVPTAVATEFHFAATHADDYRQIRCWCGCDRAFGHRSLADCFIRSDGRAEAHGAGCAVCLGEAAEARAAIGSDTPPAAIAAAIDAHWGTPTTTAPTRT